MKNSTDYTANETVNEMLNELDSTIERMARNLKLNKRCIISHNYIVQIGAYTIGSEDKKAKLQITKNPSQWNEEGVKEIMSIEFKNSFGDVLTPTVFMYKDWFKKELRQAWETRKYLLIQIHSNK